MFINLVHRIFKTSGELHLMTLFYKYKFPVVFTRVKYLWSSQQLYRIIPRTIIYLKLNKKLDLHGNGLAKGSFININDVINASLKVIENGRPW